MAKRGPKLTQVDWEKVDKMLQIQCTGEEIAGVFGISYDTLERCCKRDLNKQFADYSAEKRAVGRASLRRRQWITAEGGNPTMQIWLGKQMLGQSDKAEISTPQPVEITITRAPKCK